MPPFVVDAPLVPFELNEAQFSRPCTLTGVNEDETGWGVCIAVFCALLNPLNCCCCCVVVVG